MEYKRIKKVVLLAAMSLLVFVNSEIAYARNLALEDRFPGLEVENEEKGAQATNISNSLGQVTDVYKYYEISVKSPGLLILKFVGLEGNGKTALFNFQKTMLSEEITVKAANPQAAYYIGKAGTYYLRLKCAARKTAGAKYTFTKKVKLGGSSFAKAEVLKKGVKKCGILGFEAYPSQRQYFKLKITKEELVRVKITKGDSCSKRDCVEVQVYKSNDKEHTVTWDCMYEGQGKGTLYIRNSGNRKTEPGTYYIVLSKTFPTSGFDYSLTWLK